MEVEPRERAGPVVVEAKGYKLKTRKAAAKRFKVTGSGKVLRRKPGKQHINKHKSTTRLKRLSKENHVDHSQIDHIIGMMPTSGIKRSTAKAATKPTADD